MPLATPDPATYKDPWDIVACAHCSTPVFPMYPRNLYRRGKPTWHHVYDGAFIGQMTCDPQLARAAQQERLTHA